jgi:hypothetical protein
MRPKVRMVFFNVRLLWGDLETLCGAEGVFVVMLLGDFRVRRGKSRFGVTILLSLRVNPTVFERRSWREKRIVSQSDGIRLPS